MSFINCNKISKSPELQAVIVEPILLSCIDGASIDDLVYVMQKVLLSLSSSYNTLKKYLFHLINYELILYNGQKQIYTIEDGGLDLLEWIKREKKIMDVDSKDIIITVE